LSETTLLAYPGFDRPMEVHPVAISYGIGVALQHSEGNHRPLAFASRILSKSEVNYYVTEKECLAILWALKKFRSIVWGCKIRVVTDHHALCWPNTKAELAGRLARWVLE
jgi:RNase H-like domain found in reverse transcriptase